VVLEEENSGTPNLTQKRKRFALKTNLDTAGKISRMSKPEVPLSLIY
jgi:hypothetical protein